MISLDFCTFSLVSDSLLLGLGRLVSDVFLDVFAHLFGRRTNRISSSRASLKATAIAEEQRMQDEKEAAAPSVRNQGPRVHLGMGQN